MFNLVRKVVAGPKKTTTFEGGELDLTYITDRVIAMAFPASDLLEKAYRNPIEDVVNYFKTHHHEQFLIVNVSSRLYNYSAFDGRVKDYEWPDHQAPPLTTLVQIAHEIYRFLRDGHQRVVAVHCNHGKGRTGTAIISFLLLIGYFSSALQCLKYYNSKRFNKDTYGVDQPCQLRYLGYIQKLLASPKISPKLVCFRLKKISHKGLSCEYYVRIQYTRNEKEVLKRVQFGLKIDQPNLLISDIFIEVYQISWKGQKRIARINCNLYFCDLENMQLTFYGKDLKLSDNHHSDFQITLYFQYFCLCHLPMYAETVCKCKTERIIEEKHWNDMIARIKECKKISNKDMLGLLQKKKQKHRESKDDSFEYADVRDKPIFRSFSSRKFKTAHQEKLQSFVEHTIQQRMFEVGESERGDIYASCIEAPKTRELSGEVQYYEDEPTIKINKVQKVDKPI